MKVQAFRIRSRHAASPREVQGLFDTGSEEGLIRMSAAAGLDAMTLSDPIPVEGIGGGTTLARRLAHFEVNYPDFKRMTRRRIFVASPHGRRRSGR